MSIWRSLALVALLVAISGPAYAHRPHFGEAATCTLENGSSAEMRVPYGDGIFLMDPASVVLLDAYGRLLAQSGRGTAFVIIPTWSGGCRLPRHA